MPNHHYEPLTDHDDSFPLKERLNSNDIPTSYFSGTQTSAPPSFHSRSNSISEVEQPVPFGAVIPGSLNTNTTSSAGTAWTSSSTTNHDEIIGTLLSRIEKLEADARAKENEDEDECTNEEGSDAGVRKLKKQRRDRCCSENVVGIIFFTLFLTVLSIMLCVIGVEFVRAWGKRGSSNCGSYTYTTSDGKSGSGVIGHSV